MADSLKINPPPAKKKRREQSYSSKYGEEFSFITNSKVSSLHAFCKPCRKDINISHGGRLDIVQHSKTAVHLRNLKMGEEGKKSQIMTSFFKLQIGYKVFQNFICSYFTTYSLRLRLCTGGWGGCSLFYF